MSSSFVMDSSQNVSQLKDKLQSIIKNIQLLEKITNSNPTFATTSCNQHQLVRETAALLGNVEKATKPRGILQKIKKRQNKRRRRKTKKAEHKIFLAQTIEITKTDKHGTIPVNTTDGEPAHTISTPITTTAEPAPDNEFQQLRNYQNAKRYLQTFELLDMLHYARAQDKSLTEQFHDQFVSLRAIWNSILVENTPKRTEERRIEDQWNEVLFGASEQTYYSKGRKSERERLREMLRIRRTWDSYVVRNKKHGSTIPRGWVLPKQQADSGWTQYQTE